MLLDVLLPNRCAGCELPGLALCAGLPRLADPACATPLRPLRVARSLAGQALRGVQRAKAGVRIGPCRHRLRRPRPTGRAGVEGAWPATARARGRRSRGRDAHSAGRRDARFRSGRRRARARARAPAGGSSRRTARPAVGAARAAARRAGASGRAAARAGAEGAASKCRRCVRFGARFADARVPDRRCLREWCDRRRSCVRAASRRRPESGGGDVRTSRALSFGQLRTGFVNLG